MKIFCQNSLIISEKSSLTPYIYPLHFLTKTQAKKTKCNMGFVVFKVDSR